MSRIQTDVTGSQAATTSPIAGAQEEGRPWVAGLLKQFQRRPVTAAVVIFVVDALCITVATLAAMAWAPGLQPEFIALCIVTLLTAGFVTVLGWWRVAGYNHPSAWRSLSLLLLPALVTIVPPLLGGLQPAEGVSLPYLLLAYILVGVHEETLYRGVILRVLRPTGRWRAALLSSLLFGLSHLSNVLVRSNPFIVLAQAVGAFCFGVGYAALRLRTNTIWFLVILHALHDLLLRYTQLPAIPLDVAQVTVLLFYGLYLLRNSKEVQGGTVSAAV